MTSYSVANLDKKWLKPALIIFSEDKPVLSGGSWNLGTNYLYLTDDNREPVSVSYERIESKQRMINGRMRSYYVADKKTFSTSWSNLPSRATEGTGDTDRRYISEHEKRNTSIKYAAGQELKKWYESVTGDFWVMMVYDSDFLKNTPTQVELYNVFFDSFGYDIVKRGQYNDLWDVDLTLVEA